MLQQVLGALEPVGQGLAYRLLDHAGTGKADQCAGFGDLDVAQHGKAGGHATGRWIAQDCHVGQPSLLHHLRCDDGARHLHQADAALLHASAAAGREHDQGGALQHGQSGGGDDRLPNGGTHATGHKLERHRNHHGGLAQDLAMGDQDRVLDPGAVAGLFQPVDVLFAVLELQGIGGHSWQLDPGVAVV